MAQYGVKEVMDMVIAEYDAAPHKRTPLIVIDYAQMTEIDNAAERTDLTGGRGNARLLSFDHSKTTEINLTLPLVDMHLLSLISGDCFAERESEVFKQVIVKPTAVMDELDQNVTGYEVALPHKPIEGAIFANVLEGNRDIGERVTAKVKDGEESVLEISGYDDDSIVTAYEGEELIIHYHTVTSKKVEKLTINPTKFPQAISLYGETLFRNQYTELDEVYHVVAHKGRIRPEYTLSMDATDAAVLELTVDLYAYTDPVTREDIYVEYIKSEDEITNDPCAGLVEGK